MSFDNGWWAVGEHAIKHGGANFDDTEQDYAVMHERRHKNEGTKGEWKGQGRFLYQELVRDGAQAEADTFIVAADTYTIQFV